MSLTQHDHRLVAKLAYTQLITHQKASTKPLQNLYLGQRCHAGCDMPLNADSHSGPLCSQCQLASKAAPGSPSKQGGGSAGAKLSTFSTHLEANSTAASVGLTHPHGQTPGEAPLAAARDDLISFGCQSIHKFSCRCCAAAAAAAAKCLLLCISTL